MCGWGSADTRNHSNSLQVQRSQLSYFHGSWSQGTISSIKHTRECSLVTAHRLWSTFLLYCKKSLKYCSFWIIPALLCLAASSSPSSLVNIRGLAQTKESAALQSCDLVLSPAPWRGEKQDFIPCSSFSISAIVKGICRRVSSVVFLMWCYTSSLLMHSSQEQLGCWN